MRINNAMCNINKEHFVKKTNVQSKCNYAYYIEGVGSD